MVSALGGGLCEVVVDGRRNASPTGYGGIPWSLRYGEVGADRSCTTSSVNAPKGIDTFSIPRRRLLVSMRTLLVQSRGLCEVVV